MRWTRQRERGAVLVVSVVVVMTIFVLSGVVLAFSVSEARKTNDRAESVAAFYLAEAAIERAKWEFSEFQDPDADGYGNAVWSSGNRDYSVSLVEVSPETCLISAVATVGGHSVGLEVVVGRNLTTRWPEGALSVVGEVDKLKFAFKREKNLILDGGDTPAVRVSDWDTHDAFLQDFVQAIDDGKMPPENLTGAPEVDVNGTKVPIAYNPDYQNELKSLTDLYDTLVTRINDLRPVADIELTDFAKVAKKFGAPGHPVTVYVSGQNEVYDQSLTGYGDLIVGNKFKLYNTDVDWHGNIYVIGDNSKNAEFEIKQGSTFNLDGNLTVLGEGYDSAKFKVKESSYVTVDGSVFVGTDWEHKKKQKAEFKVEKDGNFALNGIMSLVGPRVKVECKEKDDDGNPETNVMNITGMMQIALPTVIPPLIDCDKNCDSQFNLTVQGLVEVHRDILAVEAGVNSLESMGVSLDAIPQVEKVYRKSVTVLSWKKVPVYPLPYVCPVHGVVKSIQGHQNH